MDASKVQLWAVIGQGNKPIAFCSIQLNPVQLNYNTTERELLSTVDTLKELRHNKLGEQIKLCTDHKNLIALC